MMPLFMGEESGTFAPAVVMLLVVVELEVLFFSELDHLAQLITTTWTV